MSSATVDLEDAMLDPVSFEPLLTATLIVACGHTFNADTIASLPTNLCPLCKTAFDRAAGTQPNFALRTVVEAFHRKAAKASAVTSAAPAPVSAAAPAPVVPVPFAPPRDNDNDNDARFFDLTGDDLRKYEWFHGGLSSVDAFSLLADERVGAFLVRCSSRPRCFVVSWVQSRALVIHTLIEPTPKRRYRVEGDNKEYKSIAKIVKSYKPHLTKVLLRKT
jgi:hypothetical protein